VKTGWSPDNTAWIVSLSHVLGASVGARFAHACYVGAAKARPDSPQRFSEAVGAARRLPCGTRARGPSRNSLRSLRSLRSSRRAESDDEAR